MTDEELKAIRERLEKVDPWPWNWIAPGPGSRYGSITNAVRGIEARFEGNGPFIAHAPADVSALLSDLDRSRTEIAALRRGIAAVRDDIVKADDPGSDVWIAALSALLR
jgi:hypothetical protein